MSAINEALQSIIKTGKTAPLSSKTRIDTALERIASRPAIPSTRQQPSTGPSLGLAGRFFQALAIPGQIVRSGIKETIDLFQGEGFNFGEFRDQALSKEWFGFGDIIREEGIDLGKWGNRALGLVGDIATDPFTASGGMAAVARAGGTKGLRRNLQFVRKEITDSVGGNLNKLSKTQRLQMSAIDDAIKESGKKGGSISAARNVLTRKHGQVGANLVDDLGIQTGLRFRVPATGPFLGGLTRTSQRMARKRAGQVSPAELRQLKQLGVKGDDLSDMVFKAQSKKRLKDLPKDLNPAAREIIIKAARVPVDTLPIGVFPIASGISASIMAAPGRMFEKVATTKMGQKFKQVFVDPQTEVLNEMRRPGASGPEIMAKLGKSRGQMKRAARNLASSRDVDDILLADYMERGFTRSNMGTAYGVERMQKHTHQMENWLRSAFPDVDDVTLGNIIAEPDWVAHLAPDELIQQLENSVVWRTASREALDPAWLERLAAKYPGLTLEEIGTIKIKFQQIVEDPEMRMFMEEHFFGMEFDEEFRPVGKFLSDVDDVLTAWGGYGGGMILDEAGIIKLQQIFGPDWAEHEVLSDFAARILDDLEPAGSYQDVQRRFNSNRMKQRSTRPSHIDRDGQWVDGVELEVPNSADPFDKSLNVTIKFKHPGGMREGMAQRGLYPNLIWNEASQSYRGGGPATTKAYRLQRNMSDAERAARKVRGRMAEDASGRSIQQQVDDVLIAQGWLEAGESLFVQGFAAKRANYVNSMAAELRLLSLERNLAKEGIIFNADDWNRRAEFLEGLEETLALLQKEMDGLSAQVKASNARVIAMENMGVTLNEAGEEIAGSGRGSLEYIRDRYNISERLGLEAEADFDQLMYSLVDENAEVITLSQELQSMIRDLENALGIFGLADDVFEGARSFERRFLDVAGYPRRGTFGAFTQTRQVINAVEVLGPILDDLGPMLVRTRKAQEGFASLRNLRDDLVSAMDYSSSPDASVRRTPRDIELTGRGDEALILEERVEGVPGFDRAREATNEENIEFLGRIITDYAQIFEDDLDHINNTLIPLLKERIDQTMLADRTVKAVELMQNTIQQTRNLNLLSSLDIENYLEREFADTVPLTHNNFPGELPMKSSGASPFYHSVDEELAELGGQSLRDVIMASTHPYKTRIVSAFDEFYKANTSTLEIVEDMYSEGLIPEGLYLNYKAILEEGGLSGTVLQLHPTTPSWTFFGETETLGTRLMKALEEAPSEYAHDWTVAKGRFVRGLGMYWDSTLLYGADRAGKSISIPISGDRLNVRELHRFTARELGPGSESYAFIKEPESQWLPEPNDVTYRWYDPTDPRAKASGWVEDTIDLPGGGTNQEVWTQAQFYTDRVGNKPSVAEYFNLRRLDKWEDFTDPMGGYAYGSRPGYKTIPTSNKPQRVLDWEAALGIEMTQDIRFEIANQWQQYQGDRTRSIGYGSMGFRMATEPITEGKIWFDDISQGIDRLPTSGMATTTPAYSDALRNIQNGLYVEETIHGAKYAVPSVVADKRVQLMRRLPGEDPLTILPPPAQAPADDVLAEIRPYLKVLREFNELESEIQTNFLSDIIEDTRVLFDDLNRSYEALANQSEQAFGARGRELMERIMPTLYRYQTPLSGLELPRMNTVNRLVFEGRVADADWGQNFAVRRLIRDPRGDYYGSAMDRPNPFRRSQSVDPEEVITKSWGDIFPDPDEYIPEPRYGISPSRMEDQVDDFRGFVSSVMNDFQLWLDDFAETYPRWTRGREVFGGAAQPYARVGSEEYWRFVREALDSRQYIDEAGTDIVNLRLQSVLDDPDTGRLYDVDRGTLLDRLFTGSGIRSRRDVQITTAEQFIELSDLIQYVKAEASEALRKGAPRYTSAIGDAEWLAGERIVIGMDDTKQAIVNEIKDAEARWAEAEKGMEFWDARERSVLENIEKEGRLVREIHAKQAVLEGEILEADRVRNGYVQELTAELGSGNGKAFNLNSFGGGVDLNNLTASQLRDIFNNSTRQMWGPWRVSGDEYIANSVIDAMLATQKMNDRQAVGDFLAKYDKVHNWMKAQMVATPGFVMRNIFGGMANMWFADIPLDVNLSTARLMNQAYKAGEGNFELGLRRLVEQARRSDAPKRLSNQLSELENAYEIVRSGGHGGGQAASSVEIDLGQPGKLDYVVGNKNNPYRQARISVNPLEAGFFLFAGVRHANAFAEQMMRLGTGLHVMNTGGSLEEALQMIYKLHFNYGGLSAVEQKFGKRFFPFYTWSRKNLPLQVELATRNPGKFSRLQSLKENLEFDEEKEGMVPDYFLENFNIQLPWKIGGSVTYATPDLPLQDLFRLDPTREGGKMALEQVMSGATPFFKTPIEYWAGKKMFAGIPYRDEFVKLPVAIRSIPGMTTSIKMLGWGDKNSAGDWMINDKKLGIIENMLPFLGRFRRIIPEDEKTQETWIQTIMSTLGGVSVRINTPRQQRNEEIRRAVAASKDRDVWKSFNTR